MQNGGSRPLTVRGLLLAAACKALEGADVEMTLEVQVKAPGGIDEQTARIVLENSAALKVENPGLY